MIKKAIIYIGIIGVIIFGLFHFLRKNEISQYKEKGNEVIRKVKEYKKTNNRLPNSITDFKVDIEMGEGPYYKKLNDTTFIIYYNIGFDDKFMFNSNKKEWEWGW